MWETSNPIFILGIFSSRKDMGVQDIQGFYKKIDFALSNKTDCVCMIYSNYIGLQQYCNDRGHLYKKIKLDPIEINANAYLSAIRTSLRELNGLLIVNDNTITYDKIQGMAKQQRIPCKYIKFK